MCLVAMVGMAGCAVPARVVAGGTNIRATLASKELRRCTRRGHRSAMSLPRQTRTRRLAEQMVRQIPIMESYAATSLRASDACGAAAAAGPAPALCSRCPPQFRTAG